MELSKYVAKCESLTASQLLEVVRRDVRRFGFHPLTRVLGASMETFRKRRIIDRNTYSALYAVVYMAYMSSEAMADTVFAVFTSELQEFVQHSCLLPIRAMASHHLLAGVVKKWDDCCIVSRWVKKMFPFMQSRSKGSTIVEVGHDTFHRVIFGTVMDRVVESMRIHLERARDDDTSSLETIRAMARMFPKEVSRRMHGWEKARRYMSPRR